MQFARFKAMSFLLGSILGPILLSSQIGLAATPFLVTAHGDTVVASLDLQFPLKLETSSLCYDPKDNTFYTTADKGEPHIVQFRIAGDSIEIIRTGTFVGLDTNLDFEGLCLVSDSANGDMFFVSTERPWTNDSLMIVALEKESFKWRPDLSFFANPEGMGENNNWEGIASLDGKTFYLAKERSPALVLELIGRNGRVVEMADSSTFAAIKNMNRKESYNSVDSILGGASLGRPVAFSDLAWAGGFWLLALNRHDRSMAILIPHSEMFNSPATETRVAVGGNPMLYFGIDDSLSGDKDPDILKYGIVEGLAVAPSMGEQGYFDWTVITDPGMGGYPRLVVWRGVDLHKPLTGLWLGYPYEEE